MACQRFNLAHFDDMCEPTPRYQPEYIEKSLCDSLMVFNLSTKLNTKLIELKNNDTLVKLTNIFDALPNYKYITVELQKIPELQYNARLTDLPFMTMKDSADNILTQSKSNQKTEVKRIVDCLIDKAVKEPKLYEILEVLCM
jgi:hypothetical protein